MEDEKSKLDDNIQVLIVDDSGFSRSLLTKELNTMDITNDQIQESSSGADALLQIQSKQFDLFVLDIVMEEIDGIAVLKEVKKSQPNAKVIMCSGSNSDDIIKEVIELGIDAFLVKPYQSQVFKKAVCRILSKQVKLCSGINDYWEAKCHRCDCKMIEVNLINTVQFYCPNRCMTIGPLMNVLVSQKELDEDYEKARQKGN